MLTATGIATCAVAEVVVTAGASAGVAVAVGASVRPGSLSATLEAQAVPDQRIWEAADINKATWKAYEDLLARTHVTAPSGAFDSNRLKRLTSYPKRYLADAARSLALAGVDVAQLAGDPSLARRYLESYVMQQLRPQVDSIGGALRHSVPAPASTRSTR
ncbi:MAG TPA: hypothetical protein PK020_17080 [Ilumatobacteraceae bacterium]|nr:hypothetical protein [Ilumatobacteraceae bacterium]